MRAIGGSVLAIGMIAFGCAQLGSGLWPDASVLRDPNTLNLQIVRQWTETINFQSVRITELYYNSWEVRSGVVQVVRVHGFYAVPNSLLGRRNPAVILVHGLGGVADAGATARFALQHGVVAFGYSAPGNGNSGGARFNERLLWDTIPDPRGSWFWAQAVAGSRAITLLSVSPDVDPARIGMSGYSAGAMAVLNVNGFDPRLRMAIAISGTGGMRRAAQEGGWIVHLLHLARWRTSSAVFQRFCDTIDPIHRAGSQHAPMLLINGAQDEFFPITCTLDTFSRFPGTSHRLLVIPNWDHGLFTANLPYPYETFDNREFANRRIESAVAMWIGHHLRGDGNYPDVPPIPTAIMQDYFGWTALGGSISTNYQVVEVHVYYSNDGSWLYGGQRMTDRSGNLWYKLATGLPWSNFNPGNTVYFSEFRLRWNSFAPEFWWTSIPSLPSGFVPRIRPMPNAPAPPPEGDVDGSGCVNDTDLMMVLFSFGQTGYLLADLNNDRRVDDADLQIVLFNFGRGC